MSSFIAVDIATRSKLMHPASAHLFVDNDSSKNDLENSPVEMKTECSSPTSIRVAEPVDKSDWTCPWCYRENEWKHERCPACDRFKMSDGASHGDLGDIITRVKVRTAMAGANPILNKNVIVSTICCLEYWIQHREPFFPLPFLFHILILSFFLSSLVFGYSVMRTDLSICIILLHRYISVLWFFSYYFYMLFRANFTRIQVRSENRLHS